MRRRVALGHAALLSATGVHTLGAALAPPGPYGFGSPNSLLLRSAPTSRRPLLRFVSFAPLYRLATASTRSPSSPGSPRVRALLYDLGRVCRRLPDDRCCLPPSLTASASATFFTRLDHTARTLAVYASAFGSPLCGKTRFRLYLRPWPGGVGYPRGIFLRFQLIAFSLAGGVWRTRKPGSSEVLIWMPVRRIAQSSEANAAHAHPHTNLLNFPSSCKTNPRRRPSSRC